MATPTSRHAPPLLPMAAGGKARNTTAMKSRLRSPGAWCAALALALATASLAGCGGDGDTSPATGGSAGSAAAGGDGGSTGTAGSGGEGGSTEVPVEEDPYDPAPAPRTWSEGELSQLAASVGSALDSISGASISALIVGLDSGQVLFERNPDTVRTPASNTKLFTTGLGLVLHGEEHRPGARIYGAGAEDGTIDGDVVLVVEHDPTTGPWFGESARQVLDGAAQALVAAGVSRATGNAVASGEAVYGGDSLGTINFAGERAELATAFLQALESAGLAVDGTATSTAGFDAPGSALLLELPSAAQGSIVHAINVPSHNELADLWLHHLGWADSGQSTYGAGFEAIADGLDTLGVAHSGLLLNDGSGLSHDNRVSPRHIVDLLTAMSELPEFRAYVDSLAVAGLRGTIASRMTGADTAGRFFGKTGTLTGVVALSGVLFHRHDGQRYVASFLVNGVSSSAVARAGVDAAVTALGEDRRGEPELPAAPKMASLVDDANGATAVATFTDVASATGYLLWRSADGLVWRREDARLINSTTHRTFCLDGSLFVRVTAVGDAGEGPPSDVFAARCSDEGARVLLVDADDRFSSQPVPENPLGHGHCFAVEHAAAIPEPLSTVSSATVASGSVALADFDLVVWMAGREGVADESFSEPEQAAVRSFVEDGGRLLVSGAEVAYDLVSEGSATDQAFAAEILGVDFVSDDAGTTFVSGLVGGVPRLARFSRLGTSEVAYPDVIAPAAGGEPCLQYLGAASGAACVVTDIGAGRVVVLGIPLESLEDAALRASLASLVLEP